MSSQILRDKVEKLLLGGRETGIGNYLVDTEFHFKMMKKFWEQIAVMVAQHCE
jgi:hypothetical protein